MPRTARKKSQESMYHIMSRSISEIDLFQCNDDKEYYLKLLKRYKDKYHCRIFSYILMDNHVHFYIDPCGFDISTFMRCLNTAYVTYFNRKYNRHGHLFQGRYASSIVDNDTYSLTLSAYIHNNASDLPRYCGKEEMYRYSSYGIYTGYRKDTEEIIDMGFILNHFSRDVITARQRYRGFTESMRGTGIMKEVNDKITEDYTENDYESGKSYVARDKEPKDIIDRLSLQLGESLIYDIRRKHSRQTSSDRAFVTYIMRDLCGYTYKNICDYIGNMSISGISRLVNEGYNLLNKNKRYQKAFNDLIQAA